VDNKFLADLVRQNANSWNSVWKAVNNADGDRNGFLTIDELD
jgi:hypothetical protein